MAQIVARIDAEFVGDGHEPVCAVVPGADEETAGRLDPNDFAKQKPVRVGVQSHYFVSARQVGKQPPAPDCRRQLLSQQDALGFVTEGVNGVLIHRVALPVCEIRS